MHDPGMRNLLHLPSFKDDRQYPTPCICQAAIGKFAASACFLRLSSWSCQAVVWHPFAFCIQSVRFLKKIPGLCSSNSSFGFGLELLLHVFWIPFGDHPLKLERYRED